MPNEGPDQVVLALRWGWTSGGIVYMPERGEMVVEYRPLTSDNVTQMFRDIVRDNYPDYELQ